MIFGVLLQWYALVYIYNLTLWLNGLEDWTWDVEKDLRSIFENKSFTSFDLENVLSYFFCF